MKEQCICHTPLQALLIARSAEPALLEATIAGTFGRSLADGTLVLDSVVYSLADLRAKCGFIIYCRRCDTLAFFRQASELRKRVESVGLCRKFPDSEIVFRGIAGCGPKVEVALALPR